MEPKKYQNRIFTYKQQAKYDFYQVFGKSYVGIRESKIKFGRKGLIKVIYMKQVVCTINPRINLVYIHLPKEFVAPGMLTEFIIYTLECFICGLSGVKLKFTGTNMYLIINGLTKEFKTFSDARVLKIDFKELNIKHKVHQYEKDGMFYTEYCNYIGNDNGGT